MSRPAAVAALLALLALVAVVAALASSTPTRRQLGYGQVKFNGAGPERWAQRWRREHRRLLAVRAELRRQRRALLEHVVRQPRMAITLMFGPYAGQALAVADCETGGTYSTGARNGQHAGLFQMGAGERHLYGHGSTPLAQARAAYVYFVVTGRDWSPWTCKP
jgi:hypothetical protein